MNNVLITGGAGAIGSRLAGRLSGKSNIIVVDDLSSGYQDNLPAGVIFRKGDISSGKFVKQLFNEFQFDYIFHFAALFANQNSVDNPEKDLKVNGDGTLKLILSAIPQAKKGVLKRFLFASSSCVYGTKNGKITEDDKFLPETPYAITKILGERYLQYAHENENFPITILRFFNSYGPGERPGRYRNVIPNFIALASANRPLIITGTGEESRDFTYVDDVCNCIQKAYLSQVSNGKIYNVATGRETKIKDLAEMIVTLTRSKSEIIFKERRSWDNVKSRCGDIAKAKSELGFEPTVSLSEGISNTISWIQGLESKYFI